MKKIPLLFAMEFDDRGNRVITDDINPRAEVLFDPVNEIIATVKFDGTAVLVDEDNNVFTRRNVKPGKKAPEGFVIAEHDEKTGNTFGWEPAENSQFKKFLNRAIANHDGDLAPGTYELVGPKINGNPENVDKDMLLAHGSVIATEFPTIDEIAENRDDLKDFLRPLFDNYRERSIEGIVFWVNGVPSVKLRVKDFFPEMDSRFRR